MKLQTYTCRFIKKETLALVFFCEFCKISKKNFSYIRLPVAASDSILPMYFLSAYSRTRVTVKQTSYQTAIFSEQLRLHWNESSHLKEQRFRRKNFVRIPCCLEQLLLFNNYFLGINTFSVQLLLEDDYFFRTATVSEELFLQNK